MMLRTRWLELCGSVDLDGARQWEVILDAYSSSSRAYHNLSHIEDCLGRLDEASALAADRVSVEFAIWFHDLVYDPKAEDNEEQSALAAAGFLGDTPLGSAVSDLIRATDHTAQPTERDSMLLCDIDLSILGREADTFSRYSEAIRQEYCWVSQSEYAVGRAKVLRAFLNRDAIYRISWFRERFEMQARVNLQAELARYSTNSDQGGDGDTLQRPCRTED